MLSVTNPEIMSEVALYASGLVPVRKPPDMRPCLVIKGTKEMILTAKRKHEFVIYLVPASVDGLSTCGIVTAFFDDFDEPLVISTPLFDDEFATDLFAVLACQYFDVHFVTEGNLELMAWRCRNDEPDRVEAVLSSIQLFPGSLELGRVLLSQMTDWFARRSSDDDRDRIIIREAEMIVTPRMLVDARPQSNSYNGRKQTMYTTLERPNPGEQSELEIVALLRRVFFDKQIFLSPARSDNGRELVDVLVNGPNCLVLVQAKDSPNTAEVLDRPMTRKKAIVESHLKKAAAQLRGSISYFKSDDSVEVVCNGRSHSLSPRGRRVIGLIVVKELFPDEYSTYSRFAFDLLDRTGVQCFIMDAMEFHSFTFHCRAEGRFLEALQEISVFAQRHGQYPRSRFGLVEPGDEAR